jgi:hypothetical protein
LACATLGSETAQPHAQNASFSYELFFTGVISLISDGKEGDMIEVHILILIGIASAFFVINELYNVANAHKPKPGWRRK